MARYVKGPRVVISSQTLPISKGGTSTDTVDKAKGTLKIVKNATVGQPNGPVPLDATGKIASNKFASAAKVSLDGALAVIATQTLLLEITDFDSFKNYTLSVSAGTVTRVGKTITYVSPSTAQTVNLTINGKVYNIDVQVAAPVKPSITAPIANAVVLTASYTLTSSAFSQFGDSSTHLASDWQVSTNVDFSAPLANVVADTVNKTTYTVAGLVDTNVYYARVRYKASNGNYGSWSDARVFSIAIPVPIAPTISSPANNATGVSSSLTFTASVFGALGDNSTHASSDWQVATENTFSTTVKSTSADSVNKTSWSVSDLATNTNHYVRVRYRSSNGKVSPWSPVIAFKTVDAFVFNTAITSDVYNYNMRAAAVGAGWNQVTPLRMTVTVNSGFVVGSGSTGVAAFDTGNTFPAGTTLALINNSYIVGAGGEGGRGGGDGDGGGSGTGGYAGGPALNAQYPLTVTNNGTIGGGGGGGGGAQPFVYGIFGYGMGAGTTYIGVCGGGGGGGAGRYAGQPGRDGDGSSTWADVNGGNTFTGGAGSLTGGGGGGAGQYGNYGGGGGSLGQPGTQSSSGSVPYYAGSEDAPGNTGGGGAPANPGGAAGAAAVNSGNITWVSVGTRLGPLA